MFKLFSFCSLLLFSSISFAKDIECQLVGGVPSLFMVKNFNFTQSTDGSTSNFNLNTTNGNLTYKNIECKNENIPDPIYSCEHDDFVMIIMLDEKPLKAVINPMVYAGKEYGPFFYVCK